MICCTSRSCIILCLEYQFLSRENCVTILCHKTLCNAVNHLLQRSLEHHTSWFRSSSLPRLTCLFLSFKKSENHSTNHTFPQEKKGFQHLQELHKDLNSILVETIGSEFLSAVVFQSDAVEVNAL